MFRFICLQKMLAVASAKVVVVPGQEVDVSHDEESWRYSDGPVVNVVTDIMTSWVRIVKHHHLQTGFRTKASSYQFFLK